MERYSARFIDDLGRILLHKELRYKLNLKPTDEVYFKVVSNSLVIHKASKNNINEDYSYATVDELGMVKIPLEIRKQLGWKIRTKLVFYNVDDLTILKLE